MSAPIARSLLWLTIAEALYNFSGYIIHAVAGRVLGPADYGRYALVITLTTTLIILAGNGIPTAMSRFLGENFERDPGRILAIKRTGIRLQAILIVGLAIIFFFAAPFIAKTLGDPSLTPLFQISTFIIPAFAASSFYFYYFTGIHRFGVQAALKMTRAVLRIVITVPLVIFFGLLGAIAGYVVVPTLTFVLGLILDRRHSRAFREAARTTMDTTGFSWRPVLVAALPITAFLVSYEILVSADLYLVKRFLGDDAATGIYNAALTLGRVPHYLFYALAIVILPTLAKLKSDADSSKISALLGDALRWSGIILVPVAILLAVYAESAATLFFGERFAASAEPLRVLAVGLSFLTVFYVICSGLVGLGRAGLAATLTFIGTIVSITLNILLIPSFGLMGAAWATSLAAIATTFATMLILRRSLRIPVSPIGIAKVSLAGSVLLAGAVILPADGIFFLLPATLLAILYFGILFMLGILTRDDLTKLLPKKKVV